MIPEELAATMEGLGSDWADKEAAANLLEETRKSIRAKLVLKYLPGAKAINKAEAMAEADAEYMKHIADMVDARRQATRARVKYDSYKIQIELIRSSESTRRAELTLR